MGCEGLGVNRHLPAEFLGLPDSVNRNAGRPVKSESQISHK